METGISGPRLSDRRRRALAVAIPYLLKMGVKLPDELVEGSKNGKARRLKRDEVKRLEKWLDTHGIVVVTVKGLHKKFYCMSVRSYLNKAESAKKAAATRKGEPK